MVVYTLHNVDKITNVAKQQPRWSHRCQKIGNKISVIGLLPNRCRVMSNNSRFLLNTPHYFWPPPVYCSSQRVSGTKSTSLSYARPAASQL